MSQHSALIGILQHYSEIAPESLSYIKEEKQKTDVSFIDDEKNSVHSVPGSPAIIRIKKGDQYIKAESEGYKTELRPIARVANTLTIEMEKIAVAVTPQLIPLSFAGRSP